MNFVPYPFERLNALLKDTQPDCGCQLVDFTIGEPQFDTPKIIIDTLCENISYLNKYPKSSGEDVLKESIIHFVKTRFDVELCNEELIPGFGTREMLFNFPQFLLHDIDDPVMAYTNPFYQIYEGAAKCSNSRVIHINLNENNHFKPYIGDYLKDCDLVILNFPNNPTGVTLSLEELKSWVIASKKYDFVLLNDECYSEIYVDKKPYSLLQASKEVGNIDFENILVVNSISKRSSAPGLRSGFIAGDKKILKAYMKYRTYTGCASPLPLQYAAAAAWRDEDHAIAIRENYCENIKLAEEILGIKTSKATFYVWLKVDDDLDFTKKLYEKYNIKVLPGSFLGRDGEGEGYVRIALVYEPLKTKLALDRLKKFINN